MKTNNIEPKELVEQTKIFFKKLGFKVYDDFQKQMPNILKRFDDINVCWVAIPVDIENIDGEKSKYTYAKFNYGYRMFGGKNTLCFDFVYNTGGSSGNYNYESIESYITACLTCHHIIDDLSKYKPKQVITQLSIFDF